MLLGLVKLLIPEDLVGSLTSFFVSASVCVWFSVKGCTFAVVGCLYLGFLDLSMLS